MKRFFGRPSDRSFKAKVLEIDGELAGILGYWVVAGRAVVFSDIRAPIPKMTIWRESKAFLESLRIPAICVASDTSGPFLERLGWVFSKTTEDGDVYEWQASL